ncbi:signal peptidase I [Methylovirgula sp. 4M-Z18]|uniref:signal peptidase I n=1 Tax=Methylovirgula sp. 4M-Z18 TaxID=2293567 RepID=UPI000E2EDB00|nr:signal peptidase I [Methylovirgula sp. 4M-Z18]RFB80075.1 signal peptidase I [Methylovirgula sp. 4M-Z18]
MTISSRTDQAAKPQPDGSTWETVKVVFQALLIALVVRTLLFQPFNIPSGSLIPTLLVGDYLFVSKYAYGYSKYSLPCNIDVGFRDFELVKLNLCPYLPSGRVLGSMPKRGDVAVFKVPTDNETDFIKRVIGLPGDRIQMRQGELYINDTKVPRELVIEREEDDGSGRMQRVRIYNETLPGGVTHLIQTLGDQSGPANNTEVYTVPPRSVFMMGDNRDNSEDSRMGFGGSDDKDYVPLENFVGRAQIIFFSLNVKENGERTIDGEPATEPFWQFWRWPWTVRWDRLFQSVR